MSTWNWIADVVLSLLLVGTLTMAIRLDRALKVVRGDRAAFEALITNLGSATNSVKLGIQALRDEARRAAEQIEQRSGDADKMATDLSFLIDAANRACSSLEEALPPPSGRTAPLAPEPPRPAPPPKGRGTVRPRSTPKAAQDPREPTNTPAPSVPQAPSVAPPANDLRALAGITTRRRPRLLTASASSVAVAEPDVTEAGEIADASHGPEVNLTRIAG